MNKILELKTSDGNIKTKKVAMRNNETGEVTAIYRRNFKYNLNEVALSDNFNVDSKNEIEWTGINSFPEKVNLVKLTSEGLVCALDDNHHYYSHIGLRKDYKPDKETYVQLNCIIPKGTKYKESNLDIVSEYILPVSIEEIEEYKSKR